MRWLLILLLLALPASAEEVDIELVLAVDTSRSMDFDELMLQRQGYAAALEHPAFLRAVEGGFLGVIAVTYFDWGGGGVDVILPWTRISDADGLARAAAVLRAAPVKNMRGTGITVAINAAVDMLAGNGFDGLRQVIDVSGDGPNNSGGLVTAARDRAAAAGVTVNGLPLMFKAVGGAFTIEDLDTYYADCVVTPDGFVLAVTEPDGLLPGILRKLVLEVAGEQPQALPRLQNAAGTDCQIGEKLRQRWFDRE